MGAIEDTPEFRAFWRRTKAEQALAEWKKRHDDAADERDRVIRAAHEAGVDIVRIHKLTGVSRTTVYRILGSEEDAPQGAAIVRAFCRRCRSGTLSIPCPRCDGPACAKCGRCPPCDGPAGETDN